MKDSKQMNQEELPPKGDFDYNNEQWRSELVDAYQRQNKGKLDITDRVKQCFISRACDAMDRGQDTVCLPFYEINEISCRTIDMDQLIMDLNQTTIYDFRKEESAECTLGSGPLLYIRAQLKPLTCIENSTGGGDFDVIWTELLKKELIEAHQRQKNGFLSCIFEAKQKILSMVRNSIDSGSYTTCMIPLRQIDGLNYLPGIVTDELVADLNRTTIYHFEKCGKGCIDTHIIYAQLKPLTCSEKK
jgi:hypothetical protein